MLASGDWITPRFDGLKYFEKPPLQYWATAAAYRAFGLEQWSSRLWSVGLAFACLPLVFTWVARLYGRDGALLADGARSEEHTSELQSQSNLVCRLLLDKT